VEEGGQRERETVSERFEMIKFGNVVGLTTADI
jgi:hypothetical protein